MDPVGGASYGSLAPEVVAVECDADATTTKPDESGGGDEEETPEEAALRRTVLNPFHYSTLGLTLENFLFGLLIPVVSIPFRYYELEDRNWDASQLAAKDIMESLPGHLAVLFALVAYSFPIAGSRGRAYILVGKAIHCLSCVTPARVRVLSCCYCSNESRYRGN